MLKHIPDFILPKFRPRIVEEVMNEGNVIGRVAGVNLKELDFSNEEDCDLFINGIESVKEEGDLNIYIENLESLPEEVLKEVENRTNLKFCSGDDIRIGNLPILIREIYGSLARDINSTDTLIICDDKCIILEIIELLKDTINFFTIYGISDDKKEYFYDEVFINTGISIFQPKSIQRIIKNYGTIINFSDEIDLDKFDFSNHSVIIDFSDYKPLKIFQNRKLDIFYIEDINLKSNINSNWIGEFVNPDVFATIDGRDSVLKQIYTKDSYYFIDDYIGKIKVRKGRI